MNNEATQERTIESLSQACRIVKGRPERRPRWKDEIWVQSHDIDVTAAWTGPPQCVPNYEEAAGPYQPIPGFGILEIAVDVVSSSNGGHETAVLAAGGSFIAEADLDLAYSVAIDMAFRAGKVDVAAKLRQDNSEHRSSLRTWQASNNTYYLKVWAKAHGDCAHQKRGWEHVRGRARLVYIAEPNTAAILRNLLEDNGLDQSLVAAASRRQGHG